MFLPLGGRVANGKWLRFSNSWPLREMSADISGENIWNVHTVHILTIYFGGYQVLASLKVNIEPIFSWAIPASPIHQL